MQSKTNIKTLIIASICVFSINLSQAQTISDSILRYGIEVKIPPKKYVWDWGQAVFLEAVNQKYYATTTVDKQKYLDYVKTAMDVNFAKANGRTPNAIVSGLGMAMFARETKDDRYREKALAIYNDYKQIIKSKNGGVSHRTNIIQLWDDTIYMIAMYLFEMYKLTGDKKYLDDFMEQYKIHKEILEDKKTGFWVHGWNGEDKEFDDSCCMVGWDLNPERKSHEFWGRGNGWIMMSIADALTIFPKTSPEWKILKADLIKMTANLPALQNKETGHWYQLPFHPSDSLNYQESSCTAMFSYAILTGLQQNILSKKTFLPVVQKAYSGLRKYSIKSNNSPYLIPTKICTGTCIGDKNYYYHRKIVDGKDFGLGIFAMFYQKYAEAGL